MRTLPFLLIREAIRHPSPVLTVRRLRAANRISGNFMDAFLTQKRLDPKAR